MTTVTIRKPTSISDLYCRYDRQSEAQGIYVALDCRDGSLTMSYDGEIGNAVPGEVWHGYVRRYHLPCIPTVEAAGDLLETLAPIAQRVVDGYSSDWDGNNIVAVFAEDAEDAEADIVRLCDRFDGPALSDSDAADYLQYVTHRYDDGRRIEIEGVGTITATTTDDELKQMAEIVDMDVEDGVVLYGIGKYFESLRTECIDNADA